MPQVRLNDSLYKEAQRRAAEAGFSSVDQYIADMVSDDLVADSPGETPNLDHLFTPQRLKHIDEAAAQLDSGQSFTAEQADAELARRRAEWLSKNSR